jgi:hypothetical protein
VISVARARAALTASIPRSNRALVRRANLGAAKSCSLVIIFMIRPPTVVQRIRLRQPIAAFSWLALQLRARTRHCDVNFFTFLLTNLC